MFLVMFGNDPRSRECRSKSKKSSPGLFWNIPHIQHNWPFLPQSAVLCKTLSIGSRLVECDQYEPGRLITVNDFQKLSGNLRAVDGAGWLKCHLAVAEK